MKNSYTVGIAFVIVLVLVAYGVKYYSPDTRDLPVTKLVDQYSSATGIPDGWQELRDDSYGLKAIVPETVTYKGCTKPVIIAKEDPRAGGDDTVHVGASMDCPDVIGDDVGVGIIVWTVADVDTVEDIKIATDQRWTDDDGQPRCEFVADSRGRWWFESAQPAANQWAPASCPFAVQESDGMGELEGFYNSSTHTFLYWIREGSDFLGIDGEFRIEKL